MYFCLSHLLSSCLEQCKNLECNCILIVLCINTTVLQIPFPIYFIVCLYVHIAYLYLSAGSLICMYVSIYSVYSCVKGIELHYLKLSINSMYLCAYVLYTYVSIRAHMKII